MANKAILQLPPTTARNIAVNSLLAFERSGQFIQVTLDTAFQAHPLSDADKRLATEIALGTCRHLITLDHLIQKHSTRKLRKIDPVIIQILRIALYQLIYLERTPDFAAIDQAVRQAKASQRRGSDTFVNAILRNMQRSIHDKENVDDRSGCTILPVDDNRHCIFQANILPDPTKNLAKYLSLKYAHPLWLIERWLKEFPADTIESICQTNNTRPPITLRICTLNITVDAFTEKLTQAGYYFIASGSAVQMLQSTKPDQLPGFEQGHFVVQDQTAMSVAPILSPQPGQRVLDLCAAPGGKTTHLAELMNNQGQIIACDIDANRLKQVRQNCNRLNIDMVQTCRPDQLDEYISSDGPFDMALVDVPCSNTGVLSRRVEARHLLKPAALGQLAQLQKNLLQKAIGSVKSGGKVLYSTCSIDTTENQTVIVETLQKCPQLTCLSQRLVLPNKQTASLPTADSAPPSPPLSWSDGGFTALLQTCDPATSE